MQHRLLNWTAAFLALATCGCSRVSEQAKGFPMYIADAPTQDWCGDDNRLVVTALGNHHFEINDDGVTGKSGLISRLNDQLSYRAEKVLFLRAEPGTSYSDFIEMTDAVYHPDVNIALMTHQVQALDRNGGCMILRGYPRNSKPTHLPQALHCHPRCNNRRYTADHFSAAMGARSSEVENLDRIVEPTPDRGANTRR